MKQFIFSTLIVGAAMAVDSTAMLEAVMKPTTPPPFRNRLGRSERIKQPFGRSHDTKINLKGKQPRTRGLNSNRTDNDLRRQRPDFADPARKLKDLRDRPPLIEEERTGDELILKSARARRAAIKDKVLALKPKTKSYGGTPDREPIDPQNKKFKSPVFLVNPKFRDIMMPEEEDQLFHGHYYAGHNQPKKSSTWPIINAKVRDYFSVGPDCSCETAKERPKVFALEPKTQVLVLPDSYFGEEVWEPQYPSAGLARKPHPNPSLIYRGHDFGGHNIPFPHPAPPKPHKMYD